MQPYELSKDAAEDLPVARYTLKKWGKELLAEYRLFTLKKLDCFDIESLNSPSFRVLW